MSCIENPAAPDRRRQWLLRKSADSTEHASPFGWAPGFAGAGRTGGPGESGGQHARLQLAPGLRIIAPCVERLPADGRYIAFKIMNTNCVSLQKEGGCFAFFVNLDGCRAAEERVELTRYRLTADGTGAQLTLDVNGQPVT